MNIKYTPFSRLFILFLPGRKHHIGDKIPGVDNHEGFEVVRNPYYGLYSSSNSHYPLNLRWSLISEDGQLLKARLRGKVYIRRPALI